MFLKNNNRILFILSVFFSLPLFFLSVTIADATTVSIDPVSASYRVGDTINLKVNISSDTSINAISGQISFPKDLLSVSSVLKSGSIVNLWAQEPAYSNASGTISFEGVILDGYNGNKGAIISINFKAKSIGEAKIDFVQATVLANDGNGTEVSLSKISSKLSISEAQKQMKDNIEKNESVAKPADYKPAIPTTDSSPAVTSQVIRINSIYYLLVIVLIIIFVLICIFIYRLHHKNKNKKSIKKELENIEGDITKDFVILKKDIDNDDRDVYKDLKSVEKEIKKEIEKLEKEL